MRNHAIHEGLGTSRGKTRHTTKGRHAERYPDEGWAFLPDPRDGFAGRVSDDLAELLAENFVTSATSGEETSGDPRDEPVSDDVDGPFLGASPSGPPGAFAAHVRRRRPH